MCSFGLIELSLLRGKMANQKLDRLRIFFVTSSDINLTDF